MDQSEVPVREASEIAVTVENLGGIDRAAVTFDPGVTVLRGRNATNRTSLLSAIGSALGGSTASLKSDADAGQVTLDVDGATYTREFQRRDSAVQRSGDPYVDNESLVDTFVALLEDNPARRAVERGDDLRDLIMRPVDTAAIERRIEELQQEREQLSERIAEVRQRKDRLPELAERRQSLEAEIEDFDDQIETLRETVSDYEADVSDAETAESLVEELEDRRQQLNRTENQLEVTEAEIDSLESELESLADERDDEQTYTDADLEEVKQDLAVARERRRQLEETINGLLTIVEFNQDLVDGAVELPGIEPDDSGPTAELAPDDEREVVCWTCGSTVTRGDIGSRLDDLRSVVDEKRVERNETDQRVSELERRRTTIEEALEAADRIERERRQAETKLQRKRDRLADLRSQRSELRDAIADLEQEVAETQDVRDNDLLEMYEQISDLQYERGQLRQQLDDVTDEIETIESLPSVSGLQERDDQLRSDLADERARIARLEQRAVETFNDHMDELLGVLEYENIARVWIEKRNEESTYGESPSTFELHVIRESATGTGYEDTVENLSESERELIGLVFALAGYLTHEVSDTVPFILLDSLEAIDSERIGRLIDHFSAHADVLLVALLPEDAQAVDERYHRLAADAF